MSESSLLTSYPVSLATDPFTKLIFDVQAGIVAPETAGQIFQAIEWEYARLFAETVSAGSTTATGSVVITESLALSEAMEEDRKYRLYRTNALNIIRGMRPK